ncbi:MAG: winged helix-turn-helix domain-containing protein [Gallionellaceae bacterium]|jgi:hypothetical protein
MARKPGGMEHLAAAKKLLEKAKTVDELRTAQAIAFPLMFGFSIDQTATAIGRSVGITCKMRKNIAILEKSKKATPRQKQELRNRAIATPEQEAQILTEVLSQIAEGSSASKLKPLIEEKLGRKISLGTVYNMLERHKHYKPAPVKKSPKIQLFTVEDWEEPEIETEHYRWDEPDDY